MGPSYSKTTGLQERSCRRQSLVCTSDGCYIFSGVLQYLADEAKDIKKCGADLSGMVGSFHKAFDLLARYKNANGHSFDGFTSNRTAIKAGVGEIGKGIKDLADTVADCHLTELAEILNQLAVKLGIVPDVQIVEEVLKIMIDGVTIEREIASACQDFADSNWAGFGYNLIKLVKTLIESKTAESTAIVI